MRSASPTPSAAVGLLLLLGLGAVPPRDAPKPGPGLLSEPTVTSAQADALALNPDPPVASVKLVFIHHSSGENWLADENGGLGIALAANNYFVSDTNYGWGPPDEDVRYDTIGDHTDIGHWYNWFSGAHHLTYLAALYPESEQHASYSRLDADPGGENTVIMFKSCFPNSNLAGSPGDPIPPIAENPLRGQDAGSPDHTIANAKGIYLELLNYFATRPDKLFVAICAPPVQDATWAENARAFNIWLTEHWLESYPHRNVAVFDFYNVLTSNGGSPQVNDADAATGNHHRWRNGAVEHVTNQGGNTAAYPSSADDDHASAAGNRKATAEFPPLLNIAYHCWRGDGACSALLGGLRLAPAHVPRRHIHSVH